MQSKFRVGDRVKIRRNTRFSSQSSLIGVIEIVDVMPGWHHVKFPDYADGYQDQDLELVEREIKHFGIVDFCNKHYNK